jgi:hypothetical protein
MNPFALIEAVSPGLRCVGEFLAFAMYRRETPLPSCNPDRYGPSLPATSSFAQRGALLLRFASRSADHGRSMALFPTFLTMTSYWISPPRT